MPLHHNRPIARRRFGARFQGYRAALRDLRDRLSPSQRDLDRVVPGTRGTIQLRALEPHFEVHGEFRDVDPQLAAVAMFGMCFAVTRWPELQKRLSAGKLTEGMQALALGAMLRPKS